jgi:hypothetical protein
VSAIVNWVVSAGDSPFDHLVYQRSRSSIFPGPRRAHEPLATRPRSLTTRPWVKGSGEAASSAPSPTDGLTRYTNENGEPEPATTEPASFGPTSTFVRQADGGSFATPQELYAALQAAGLNCIDSAYGTRRTTQGEHIGATIGMGQCWTGVGNVKFETGPDSFRGMEVFARPRPTSAVFGRNWWINTSQDPEFAAAVKSALGGLVFPW